MQSADRIEFLVHTYADRITRIGYTWFGNVHDAQDVCQTVLLRLMTHDCPDDSPEAERAWVLRVTINVCKDIKRSAWFRRTVGLDEGAALTVELPEPGDDTLQHLWTNESQPVYEAYKTDRGCTQTADGWTVTLTDCVGSENMLYIGVELTVPEGTDPNKPYRFGDYDMTFPDGSRATIGGGINDAPPYDGPDGDTLHFVWHMNVAPDSRTEVQSLQGKTVDLTIDSVYRLDWNAETDRYDEILMTDHVWKFEDVKLDYPTADTTYAVNKPVEYLGGTATLDEIMVSPCEHFGRQRVPSSSGAPRKGWKLPRLCPDGI